MPASRPDAHPDQGGGAPVQATEAAAISMNSGAPTKASPHGGVKQRGVSDQDFGADDRIAVRDLPTNFTYTETTASDFASALTKMAELAQTGVKIATFQIGADVLILGEFFASEGLDLAIRLSGQTLDGVSQSQFVF
jgi:hypothetical protein